MLVLLFYYFYLFIHLFFEYRLFWYIIIFYSLTFLHQRQLMVVYWNLSDSKSPQVSRTLLNILGIVNNVVVWMVSIRRIISKSSSSFINLFVTV